MRGSLEPLIRVSRQRLTSKRFPHRFCRALAGIRPVHANTQPYAERILAIRNYL